MQLNKNEKNYTRIVHSSFARKSYIWKYSGFNSVCMIAIECIECSDTFRITSLERITNPNGSNVYKFNNNLPITVKNGKSAEIEPSMNMKKRKKKIRRTGYYIPHKNWNIEWRYAMIRGPSGIEQRKYKKKKWIKLMLFFKREQCVILNGRMASEA